MKSHPSPLCTLCEISDIPNYYQSCTHISLHLKVPKAVAKLQSKAKKNEHTRLSGANTTWIPARAKKIFKVSAM